MNFLYLYFIVVFRFLHIKLHKNYNDAKFSALLYTSMFLCLILLYLSIICLYIFHKKTLSYFTFQSIKIYTIALATFTLCVNYFLFYRIKNIKHLEYKYMNLSTKKRKLIGILVVSLSIITILLSFVFINNKILPKF